MTSKQLANVLIKILGLSIIIRSVPFFLEELLRFGINGMLRGAGMESTHQINQWAGIVSSAIQTLFGLWFIMQSRWLTELLFKEEID